MDYQKAYSDARANGYSDTEIAQHLSGDEAKYKEAISAGYSDADIIGHFTGGAPTAAQPAAQPPATVPQGAPKFYELEKQQGTPRGPMELLKQAARQFKEGATSPMPGSLLSTPLRAVSETANQLGADVARGASTPGGLLPNIGTVPARGAGFLTAMAADPVSYVGMGAGGKAAQAGYEAVANPMGRTMAKMAEGTSNVSVNNIIRLFKDPKAVLSALSTKEIGPELNASKHALGITPEEEFLIAKAGDRAPGTSRTVVDQLRDKMKADFITQPIDPKTIKPTDKPVALYIGRQDYEPGNSVDMFNIYGDHPKASSTVDKKMLDQLGIPVMGTEAGRESAKLPPASVKNLTSGELMALNRAAGRVAKEVKGSEKVLYGRLKEAAARELTERAPELVEQLKQYSLSKTKDSFSSVFPQNKQGKTDYFRMAGGIGAGAGINPLMALAASPIGVGAGTLAAKAAHTVAKPVIGVAGGTAGGVVSHQTTNPPDLPHPLAVLFDRVRRSRAHR